MVTALKAFVWQSQEVRLMHSLQLNFADHHLWSCMYLLKSKEYLIYNFGLCHLTMSPSDHENV